MDINNLDKVNFLVSVKTKCVAAVEGLNKYVERVESDGPDAGGYEGYDLGFWSSFSMHRDGSGASADMVGCYVGLEAAHALMEVLARQISRINDDLRELGVEL